MTDPRYRHDDEGDKSDDELDDHEESESESQEDRVSYTHGESNTEREARSKRKRGGRTRHQDLVAHGGKSRGRPDRRTRQYADGGGGHWIQGMHMKKNALHKEMGVPVGKAIPAKKLAKAVHSDNPKLAKRARLAETLKGFHH